VTCALFLYSIANWEEKVHAAIPWNVDGYRTLSLPRHSDGNCKKRAGISVAFTVSDHL
jgi:hypothetical protein